ncbi:MAG: aminotransferase class IV [Alphaproteobacteria bacterium]|nr:aminotransferase class IV [Alphaproteobacteria bacterium]
MTLWCNGHFSEHLTLAANERGLMLGDGIFETLAVRGGKPIWLEAHLTRMQGAAAALGLPFDEAAIRAAIVEISHNSAHASEVLRITLTRGPTARGLAVDGERPSLILSLNPFDLARLPASVRLATSSIRRNPTAPSSCHKTLSYVDGVAAAREVAARADDALMLNTHGHVASTTIANVFLLAGATLITPARDQGILNGIARATLIAGATELGLAVEERAVQPAELFSADCVFLTNSLRLATRVSSIDGTPCGTRDISFINAFFERTLT